MSLEGFKRPRIAVDAMGGDNAPGEIILGAYEAAKKIDAEIILVGSAVLIEKKLHELNDVPNNISIIPASSSVDMGESAAKSTRQKMDSSIAICAKLVKDNQADIMVSAGNTGAVMSAAILTIGRAPGIPRPAIGVLLPTRKPVFLLDVGANAICKPQHLVYFAILGSAYQKSMRGKENPTVGLLNIGEEEGKGNTLSKEAYKLLESAPINFIGNVEGNGIPDGECDVVVCDGFTGNIILKVLEATGKFFGDMLMEEIKNTTRNKLGGLILKPGLQSLARRVNPERYGGAQLLGLQGMCMIAHGRSNQLAIYNAIDIASKEVNSQLLELINKNIEGINLTE